MRAVLQRLAIPIVLLVAFIAATIATDRFGNDDVVDDQTDVVVGGPAQAPDTPVFSVRRAPELLTSPRAAEELNLAVADWVATLPPNSCFVVSAGGERLYEHQSDLPLTPASNMKLLTAVAALAALGPDFRFETRVAALQRPDDDGRLPGDLYIIGGGDPVLMTDAYIASLPKDASRIHTSADTLADQTIATNIADIEGAVVVVEDRYDRERQPEGTPNAFLENGLLGSLSAAMVDQGFVGYADGYSARGKKGTGPLPRAEDPALELASVFDDLLETRNVRIAAQARVEKDPPTGQLVDLLVFQSPPLSEIVAQMLLDSDNTTAEMLVKELGYAAKSTNGSTTAGLLEISAQLNALGLQGSAAFAFDGSGMSSETKATCALIHDALANPASKDLLREALPVAGETGTLASAFKNTPGEGRLRAKTGRLNAAAALSGYFLTEPGVELTFAFIVNAGDGEKLTGDQVSGWRRPLPELLAPYPQGPPLADLGPKGAPAPTPVGAAAPTDDAATDDPAPDDPADDAETGN